jgi:hypothetical protein
MFNYNFMPLRNKLKISTLNQTINAKNRAIAHGLCDLEQAV